MYLWKDIFTCKQMICMLKDNILILKFFIVAIIAHFPTSESAMILLKMLHIIVVEHLSNSNPHLLSMIVI